MQPALRRWDQAGHWLPFGQYAQGLPVATRVGGGELQGTQRSKRFGAAFSLWRQPASATKRLRFAPRMLVRCRRNRVSDATSASPVTPFRRAGAGAPPWNGKKVLQASSGSYRAFHMASPVQCPGSPATIRIGAESQPSGCIKPTQLVHEEVGTDSRDRSPARGLRETLPEPERGGGIDGGSCMPTS